MAANFSNQIAEHWVSLLRQFKKHSEPSERFCIPSKFYMYSQRPSPISVAFSWMLWPEICFLLSPGTYLHMSYTLLTSKNNLRQCTSIQFQHTPGTCDREPASIYILNVVRRNHQFVFVKFFGMALS